MPPYLLHGKSEGDLTRQGDERRSSSQYVHWPEGLHQIRALPATSPQATDTPARSTQTPGIQKCDDPSIAAQKPRLPLLARRRVLEAVSPQQSVAQLTSVVAPSSELPRIIGPMATVGVCPDDPRPAPLMYVQRHCHDTFATRPIRHIQNATCAKQLGTSFMPP